VQTLFNINLTQPMISKLTSGFYSGISQTFFPTPLKASHQV
jgi:hypothetical protein